jgi:hypothetical protein
LSSFYQCAKFRFIVFNINAIILHIELTMDSWYWYIRTSYISLIASSHIN